jgi:uncharacterized membrane protein YiaA
MMSRPVERKDCALMRWLPNLLIVGLFAAALLLATQGHFALALAVGIFSAALPLVRARKRHDLSR